MQITELTVHQSNFNIWATAGFRNVTLSRDINLTGTLKDGHIDYRFQIEIESGTKSDLASIPKIAVQTALVLLWLFAGELPYFYPAAI